MKESLCRPNDQQIFFENLILKVIFFFFYTSLFGFKQICQTVSLFKICLHSADLASWLQLTERYDYIHCFPATYCACVTIEEIGGDLLKLVY